MTSFSQFDRVVNGVRLPQFMKMVNGKDVDREVLLQLRYELWPHHGLESLREEISRLLTSDNEYLFVGYLEQTPIGFIEVSIRKNVPGSDDHDVPYVEGWCVCKNYRGKGHGKTLMNYAEEWARGRGYRALASDTTSRYPGSLEAHRALGFEEVKRVHHLIKSLAAT